MRFVAAVIIQFGLHRHCSYYLLSGGVEKNIHPHNQSESNIIPFGNVDEEELKDGNDLIIYDF